MRVHKNGFVDVSPGTVIPNLELYIFNAFDFASWHVILMKKLV